MTEQGDNVRLATTADAREIGRMLDAFNREFDDETPGAQAMAERLAELVGSGETVVLVVPESPSSPEALVGLCVLRFRPSLWSRAMECYLAELYVQPEHRGQGLGRALLNASMEAAISRGADYMDLGTSETDVAARSLYESAGFTNREGGPDGPVMLVYERSLDGH